MKFEKLWKDGNDRREKGEKLPPTAVSPLLEILEKQLENAPDWTRTSMPCKGTGPQPAVYTNSTTGALCSKTP